MTEVERIAYKVNEAARALGYSRTQIYDLVNRGVLPALRLGGGSIRIPKAAIEKLISQAIDEK
jgi:excisionase family DNA binding protein